MQTAKTIVVAGAGAIGSAVALTLARAGHAVMVADPAPLGANASGVAAGMLAPAFESLFDEAAAGGFELLAAARDAWPAMADADGVLLARDGALAVGAEGEARAWSARLAQLGARHRILAPAEAARLAPWLKAGLWAVFSPEDWRLDPRPALVALRQGAQGEGARFLEAPVTGFDGKTAHLEGQPPIRADLLVIATGADRGLAAAAPELAALRPVKGQLVRADEPKGGGPAVRAPGVYLCPTADGVILGASMEEGRADTAVDPAIVRDLIARAEAIAPGLGSLSWRPETGVRATTPDGLPLVGLGCAPGVVLAVGARRNGWLLAPLIAGVVLDLVEDRAAGPWAARFDPARLATSPG
jgi:glycine oxidase